MDSKTKFSCEKCKREMALWDIFKLSLGYQGEIKKYKCVCRNELRYKIHFLWAIPVILVGIAIVEIPKTFIFITVWIISILAAFLLYFAKFEKI